MCHETSKTMKYFLKTSYVFTSPFHSTICFILQFSVEYYNLLLNKYFPECFACESYLKNCFYYHLREKSIGGL